MKKLLIAIPALLVLLTGFAYAFKPASAAKTFHINVYGAKTDILHSPSLLIFDHQPTLEEAIAKAGGLHALSNPARIWVIELTGENEPMRYNLESSPESVSALINNHSVIVIQEAKILM